MQGISGDRVLLPTTVACNMTGLSRGYILRLVRNGRIEGIKIGHDWLIYEDALKKFMTQPRERGRPPKEQPESEGMSNTDHVTAQSTKVARHGSSESIQRISPPIPLQTHREGEEAQKSSSLPLRSEYGPGLAVSEKLTRTSLSDTPRPNTTDSLPVISAYNIENILYSHPSRLIFAREAITGRQVVIKILIEEKNPRCDLSTIGKRQQAQLYAVQWNKRVTPDVYLGLAPVADQVLNSFSSRIIQLGRIIENPELADIDASSEYAVVMNRLPEDRQLSTLLKYVAHPQDYIMPVIGRIASMHQMLEALPISNERGKDWGSYQQLQTKLQENIELADSLFATHPTIFKSLSEVFEHSIYQRYFEQRRRDGYIRNCHGDLKTQNIWIIPARSPEEIWQEVKILDAISFNLDYSNIDVLSDFAMLVVDIHARTNSASLVETMIETYLNLTQQENEVARFVLDYYLLEKALVRASMRSASKHLREPDQASMKIARGYLERFHSHISSRQFKSIKALLSE